MCKQPNYKLVSDEINKKFMGKYESQKIEHNLK